MALLVRSSRLSDSSLASWTVYTYVCIFSHWGDKTQETIMSLNSLYKVRHLKPIDMTLYPSRRSNKSLRFYRHNDDMPQCIHAPLARLKFTRQLELEACHYLALLTSILHCQWQLECRINPFCLLPTLPILTQNLRLTCQLADFMIVFRAISAAIHTDSLIDDRTKLLYLELCLRYHNIS